jgi:F-type H+-transporting ATPase subunit b
VFLEIDGTLLVQIVNFVVFVMLLNVVFLRPVGAAIAKRRAYIDGLARDIEAAQHEVQSIRAAAADRRLAARREAETALSAARSEAQTQGAAIIAEFSDKAIATAEAARRRVDDEIAEARKREDEIVAALSETMIERAIGSGVGAR